MSQAPLFPFKDCCLTGYTLPGEPKGTMVPIGNSLSLPHYLISSPSSTPASPTAKVAIVLLTDIFGLNIPNPKIMADTLLASLETTKSEGTQLDIFVPDYMNGIVIPEEALKTMIHDSPGQGPKGVLGKIGAFVPLLGWIPTMIKMRPGVTVPRCEAFLKALRSQGYAKIGVMGFCLGGTQICALLGFPSQASPSGSPLFDTAIIAHPGPNSLSDIEKIGVPSAWICAEEDDSFPEDKRKQVEVILKAKAEKGIPYRMDYFPGTVHGFAARPALHVPVVKEAFQACADMQRDWMKEYILGVKQ